MRRAILGIAALGMALGPAGQANAIEPQNLMREIVLWVPNRVLDAADMFRVRGRLGPIAALGVRVGPDESYTGKYTAAWAGLPGPRQRQKPKFPFGIESRDGSGPTAPSDDTYGGGTSPAYSDTEIGFDAQLGVAGASVGFDYGEAWDFLNGLIFRDPMGDDFH